MRIWIPDKLLRAFDEIVESAVKFVCEESALAFSDRNFVRA